MFYKSKKTTPSFSPGKLLKQDNNAVVNPDIRFFVSFSSHDKAAAREIMSGLRSQNFDFWDYSNEVEAMRFTEEVKTRLPEEIDQCDYFIALVSKNSTGEKNGIFTRFEVKHATVVRKLHEEKGYISLNWKI